MGSAQPGATATGPVAAATTSQPSLAPLTAPYGSAAVHPVVSPLSKPSKKMKSWMPGRQ
jgi:hypothetical protein